ncbi:GntR family transcriptional regulator [Rhizorhabdus wittichii DC-6]|nr:GntR family transcriptional regulator [Rhizorhabdus wittichii DC-6]
MVKGSQKRPRINPEAVADQIRVGIQTGQFVPKQRLVEIDLINRYGVSRSCVRGALRILEGEGLIEIVKSQGAFVRLVTRDEVSHTLDVLDALANFVVRQAASRIDEPSVRETIEHSLRLTEEFPKDRHMPMADFIRENNRFWGSLMDSVGNPVLKRTHASLQSLLHRIWLSGIQFNDNRDQWLEGHAEILKAILAADPDRAEALAIESGDRSRADVLHLPDEAFGVS